jgi:hypothetical protein
MTTIGSQHDAGSRQVPERAASVAPAGQAQWLFPLGTVLGAAVLIGLASLAGAWYMPLLAGAGIALIWRLRSWQRWQAGAAALAGAVGWSLPLILQSARGEPIGAVARTVAALAGLPPLAIVTIAATLLIAIVQAVLGVWVAQSLLPRRARLEAVAQQPGDEPSSDEPLVVGDSPEPTLRPARAAHDHP